MARIMHRGALAVLMSVPALLLPGARQGGAPADRHTTSACNKAGQGVGASNPWHGRDVHDGSHEPGVWLRRADRSGHHGAIVGASSGTCPDVAWRRPAAPLLPCGTGRGPYPSPWTPRYDGGGVPG
ncbi:hypothetical protein [Streptomyces sp. NPDC059175]|uniref:hypothetical protein n=1 Tax=unclassified Streptomyces TaxID=2593676 RepID=UPI0036831B98